VASTLGYTREAQDAVDRVGTRILPTRQQLPVLRRCSLIARDDDCRTSGGEQPNTRRVADTALKVRLALQESTAAPERSEMTTTPFNEPEACQPLILPLMVSAPFAASPLSVAVTAPVPTKLPRLSILIVALRSPPNVPATSDTTPRLPPTQSDNALAVARQPKHDRIALRVARRPSWDARRRVKAGSR